MTARCEFNRNGGFNALKIEIEIYPAAANFFIECK